MPDVCPLGEVINPCTAAPGHTDGVLRRFNAWNASFERQHPIAAALLIAAVAGSAGAATSLFLGDGVNWGFVIPFVVLLTVARAVRSYRRRDFTTTADQRQ